MKTRIFGKPLDKTLSRFWYPELELCEHSPKDVDLSTHEINIITSPYKADVVNALKESDKEVLLSGEVEEIGCANMVLYRDGKFLVCNTDTTAFLDIMSELGSRNLFWPTNINCIKKVVIIGSGPVSKAAQYAFSLAAASLDVQLLGRTTEPPTTDQMKFDRNTLVINTAPAYQLGDERTYYIEATHLITLDQRPSKNVGTVTNYKGIEFFIKQANVQSDVIRNFFK